jgi:hypothetical protein
MITFTHIEGEWGRLGPDGQKRLRDWHAEFSAAPRAEQDSELIYFAPPGQARTVRLLADGNVRVDDGPFQRGVEFAGGYFVVDADSMEGAIEWGRRGRFMPGACEVREIVEARM